MCSRHGGGRNVGSTGLVDILPKKNTMSTPMAESTRNRRARRQFADGFKAQAARLVLDEGKGVGAVARDLDHRQPRFGNG